MVKEEIKIEKIIKKEAKKKDLIKIRIMKEIVFKKLLYVESTHSKDISL